MLTAMAASDVLSLTPAGLYCRAGDFHIDPLRAVDRALITHGHSDHARAGHGAVLATAETLGIMGLRYGENFAGATQAISYGEPLTLGEVTVSLHPAGHVLGSAQILIESQGYRVVVSGDYKRAHDPTCAPFEPIRCGSFITEATFGLPVFRHPDARAEVEKLIASCRLFPDRAHLVGAYSLGKAQRVIAELRRAGFDEPIYIHGAMQKMCDLYAAHNVPLGELILATGHAKAEMKGAIVIAPPSAMNDRWAQRLPDPITAMASGWMRVRQRARQRNVELPLVISDHADWTELTDTLLELRPAETWITHGRTDALGRWCELHQLKARALDLVGREEEDEG